jgi:hypothetical protein
LAPFYVSDAEIDERAGFLNEVAETLFAGGAFSHDRILYKAGRIPYLTRGYYLLNEAFKVWRMEPDHRTEPYKVAALLSMSIATFQPVVPIFAADAQTRTEARPNELYALACASVVLGTTINPNDPETRDFWLRILDILKDAVSATIEPYRVDVGLESARPLSDYKLVLQDVDKPKINALVCLFELIGGKVALCPPVTYPNASSADARADAVAEAK